MQGVEFLINGLGKDKRIDCWAEESIGAQARAQAPMTGLEAVEGSFRKVITAVDFGSDVGFGFKFQGRLKQVLEVEEFLGIELVEEVAGLLGFEALPAEEAADVGEVLLFDMGVIVFLVGA